MYAGDPDFYRKVLAQYAAVTPADIRSAMSQWLSRPAFAVRLEPGERPPYEDAKGRRSKPEDIRTPKVKREIPGVAGNPPLDFPDAAHVQLSNGVKVHYARRDAVPITQLALLTPCVSSFAF